MAHPGITRPADPIEPEPNAVDGELLGIMVDSKADVAVVGANVVDPVGDDFAQFLVLEIVGVDLDRPTLRAIVAAAVLELAEQFLLLRVDRYHRLIVDLKLLDLGVDIFELSVAIGMFAAFLGLAVGMAAILQFPQQLGNARGADFVTHRAKRRRQLVVALGDPSQRSRRIAHRRRLEQSFQVRQQRRILRRQPRAAPTLASHLSPERAGVPQVLQAASDRTSGELCHTRGRGDPATPPPSPPRPRSIAGLARQARNEQLHTGCGGVIRRSSKRYRRWPCRQESRKQPQSVKAKTRFNCFWASPKRNHPLGEGVLGFSSLACIRAMLERSRSSTGSNGTVCPAAIWASLRARLAAIDSGTGLSGDV